jgi:hypothetical protein
MGLQSWTLFPLGTQCAPFNELADSMFNVLALFFDFSDTKDLGEYGEQNFFEFWKFFFRFETIKDFETKLVKN